MTRRQNVFSTLVGLAYIFLLRSSISDRSIEQRMRFYLEEPDIHVVFIGYSVMRYMYLQLIYELQNGPSLGEISFCETQHHYLNATSYYDKYQHWHKEVSKFLNETSCDCGRWACCSWDWMFENRYFDMGNIHVTYFSYFGQGWQGHWQPNDRYPIKQPCPVGNITCGIYQWRYNISEVEEFVENVVSRQIHLQRLPGDCRITT